MADMMPDEPCDLCHDTGFLADQTYGDADIPVDWIPVQACDTCQKLDGDEAAATALDEMNGTSSRRWFPPEDPEGCGDWAVIA